MSYAENWAAILAGGEGQRLRQFTRHLTGDDRPKQFCRLLGQQTLLGETRNRVCLNVAPGRTVYVVTSAHEPYYSDELRDVPASRRIEQPCNRGTAPALVYLLARLRALGATGVVGLFPADHYYRKPDVLQRTVAEAYAFADMHRDRVVLLGAEADRGEVDYGWIEPGADIPARTPQASEPSARSVVRFAEKPTADIARDLLSRGCLWNTLVVVGHLHAFEAMVATATPRLWDAFGVIRQGLAPADERGLADAVYASLRPSDVSHDILSVSTDRLAVMTLPDAGWTDLGQPGRVLDVIARARSTSSDRAVAIGL